jgi:hypothetical protein
VKRPVTSTQDPPVLDEGTFQQLLAAAYTLQQSHGLLLSAVPETVRQASSLQPALRVTRAEVEALQPSRTQVHFLKTVGKQILPSDELFWKTATVVALIAVSALLLAATVHRFSPLPASLSRPVDVIPRSGPPQKHLTTVPAQSCAGDTETGATKLSPAKTAAQPTPTVASEPAANRTKPASPQKSTVKPHRIHNEEADVVAEDTVIRYGPVSTAPRLQAQTALIRPAK